MLLIGLLAAQPVVALDCLRYEPAVVQLTGTLSHKRFAGPPNYESIEKGDEEQWVWLLAPERPICVSTSDPRPGYWPQSDVRLVHLVVDRAAGRILQRRLAARERVAVRGTLFGASTGHHRAPLLMNVTEVVPAN